MKSSDDIDVRQIGGRVLLRRRELGLEQKDIAEQIGRDRGYISRLETGKIPNPKIGDLRAVARALDMTLDDLLSDQPPIMSPSDDRRLRKIMETSPLALEFAAVLSKLDDATPHERAGLLQALLFHLAEHGFDIPED